MNNNDSDRFAINTNSSITTTAAGAAEPQQDVPVMRVSNDGGQTFGPVVMLGSNGTVSTVPGAANTTTAAPVLE
jgi:hypothetical protein